MIEISNQRTLYISDNGVALSNYANMYHIHASECKKEKEESNWFLGLTSDLDEDYGEEWMEVAEGSSLAQSMQVESEDDGLEVLGTSYMYEALSCEAEG